MGQVEVLGLIPGDLVETGRSRAIFIAQTQHPLWPHLQLVIWRMPDGSWSHDALASRQVVGELVNTTREHNIQRLRRALLS